MKHPIRTFRPVIRVAVEFDSRGKRSVKAFTDLHAARKFYAAKFRARKHPRIVAA